LLTGYLRGATAAHVRVGSPLISVVFPVILGVLVADGIATREDIGTLITELDAFAHDPNTLLSFPRIFQLRGLRPERSR
jgi:hypothetical protein